MAFKSQVTITRPANTTPYNAGDVVGGVLTLEGLTGYNGDILIASARLQPNIAAIPAGMTSFRLHLYTASPASALADNAAWDLPVGDRAAYAGYIDLGSPADMGGTLFCQADMINKLIRLASIFDGVLYAYLVTNGAFTPAANSETYTLTLNALGC